MTEQEVLEYFVPEKKRDLFFERLNRFSIIPEYKSGLKKLEYIDNIFQERKKQDLPCSTNGPAYLLDLRSIRASFLAGVAIIATAREKSQHRFKAAQELIKDFVKEDLLKPEYNPIIPENFPGIITGTSNQTGKPFTNGYLSGHFFVFLSWTKPLVIKDETYIKSEPSYFHAKHIFFNNISGIGCTNTIALADVKKNLKSFESYKINLARKNWQIAELLNFKQSKQIWKIRAIAETRNISNSRTKTSKTLIEEIMFGQQYKQLAFF